MEGAQQMALAGGVMALGIGVVLAAFLAAIIVGGIVLFFAAKIAGIRNAGFLKCIIVSLVTLIVNTIVNFISGLFLGWIPILGWLMMLAISICTSAAVIQAMMNTSFDKAIICELARFAISFLAVIGTAFLMAGGAVALSAVTG